MDDHRNVRGITLVELVVVIVLIGILSSIVGPSIAGRLDNLSLQTTATQLAAQFRKAQAQARVAQTPIAAVYSNHEFHFLNGAQEVGSFALPRSVSPSFADGTDTFLLLPSGQIAGADRLELLNEAGRKAVIEFSLLK